MRLDFNMAVNLADLSLPQLEGLKNQLEQVMEKLNRNLLLLLDIYFLYSRQYKEYVCWLASTRDANRVASS